VPDNHRNSWTSLNYGWRILALILQINGAFTAVYARYTYTILLEEMRFASNETLRRQH